MKTLPYWIEDTGNGEYNIWTKITIPALFSRTIYIQKLEGYYPNGDKVFEFFDDFDGTELDKNKWVEYDSGGSYSIANSNITLSPTPDTINAVAIRSILSFTNNIIVETKVNPKSDTYYDLGLITTENILTNAWHIHETDNLGYTIGAQDVTVSTGQYNLVRRDSGSRTVLVGNIGGGQTLQPIIYRLTYTSGGKLEGRVEFLDGTIWTILSATDTTYLNDNKYVVLWQGEYSGGDGAPSEWDWVRVRKYADQEPTTTVKQINDITWKVIITNPNPYDLTDFQVKIDGTGIVESKTDSLKIYTRDLIDETNLSKVFIQNGFVRVINDDDRKVCDLITIYPIPEKNINILQINDKTLYIEDNKLYYDDTEIIDITSSIKVQLLYYNNIISIYVNGTLIDTLNANIKDVKIGDKINCSIEYLTLIE